MGFMGCVLYIYIYHIISYSVPRTSKSGCSWAAAPSSCEGTSNGWAAQGQIGFSSFLSIKEVKAVGFRISGLGFRV